MRIARGSGPLLAWLRGLSLRAKVMITVAGAALAVLGASSWLSFRYWHGEVTAATEQQALLAAGSVRPALEAALSEGRADAARSILVRATRAAPLTVARVYAADGTITLSANAAEENRRAGGVWLPSARELPDEGRARPTEDGDAVRALVPLRVSGGRLLEVTLPIGPMEAAIERGARLALVLVIASLLVVGALLLGFMEREVVVPMREAERLAETQRQQLEQQAGLAQVGEMAAEMAHEFKRPLAAIRSAIALLEQEYTLDPRGEKLLGAVEGQLEKLTDTMGDLFALAKPVEVEPVPLRITDVCDAALARLAGHSALAGVRVQRAYDPDVPAVSGDAHRLEQAVHNLLLNALEAMPTGGELTLRVRVETDSVRIEVRDSGVGIPRAEVERILTPFYSTKPQGTGLGLPLVARVVAAHSGRLTIDSDPGRGTTVSILLPAAAPAAAAS